jgi:MoaA/NifB/PqqE/SkfB family radical SAM enzyme
MKNIDYLVETNKNTVGASFVVTKKNVLELPSILSWCNNKGIRFSYHILENMGFRDWENELKPISVEHENKFYLTSLKQHLIDARDGITKHDDEYLYKRNMLMYNQYIERLK